MLDFLYTSNKKYMKRLLILALSISIFSCSSSKNVVKEDPAKKFVESAQMWENEILALEKKDRENTYPDNSILFIGSSSIRLWKNIEKDMAPYPVIQRGVGGAKLSDILVYENRLVNAHRFRAIVIYVGNDIHGSAQDRTPEEVLDIYKDLVTSIRKDHKSTPIFFIGITPTESRWKVWEPTHQANELIKTYSARNKNLHFIETSAAFLGANGMPKSSLFVEDKLHLSQDGYDIWAEIIKHELNKKLK